MLYEGKKKKGVYQKLFGSSSSKTEKEVQVGLVEEDDPYFYASEGSEQAEVETSEEEKEGGSPEEKKESESPKKEEEPAPFNPYLLEDNYPMERRGTFTAQTAPLVDKQEKVEYFQMVNGAKKFVYAPSTPKEGAKIEVPKE